MIGVPSVGDLSSLAIIFGWPAAPLSENPDILPYLMNLWSDSILNSVKEMVLGAIVAIVITIWIENLRRPKLELRTKQATDVRYPPNRPAKRGRFLALELVNKPLPRFARWMSRNAAMQCHGYITFHNIVDGNRIFPNAMPIRWSSSPELLPSILVIDNKIAGKLIEPDRYNLRPRIDVYPGEVESVDVAARFDEDDECYAWCNENYLSEPIWRNPRWRLPKGTYLTKVTVFSAGEKCMGTFRLINNGSLQDFCLKDTLSI